jgi:hypothetical protein
MVSVKHVLYIAYYYMLYRLHCTSCMICTTFSTQLATGKQVPSSRTAASAVSVVHMHKMFVGYTWIQLHNFAVGTPCAHALRSAMHMLDHALLRMLTPCVSAACVCKPSAFLLCPSCWAHQHVDLTNHLILADSCGLMLTLKGMFVL